MNKPTNLLLLVLSALRKKPFTDTEARINYTNAVWDYILDLESLFPIAVPPTSSAFKQKNQLDKLLILNDRFSSIGDEFLTHSVVDSILAKVQDMFREYLDDKLYYEFYDLRKNHYAQLINSNRDDSVPTYNRLDTLKQAAFKNLG